MLPGKAYTVDDIIAMALRRKWWVIVPFVLGSLAAYAVGKSTPFQYQSETIIMLMPPRVGYAQSASASLEDRLNTITQQVFSRSKLEQIVADFNLYEPMRGTVPTEEIVRLMRLYDIRIKIEGKDSFRLGYLGFDPQTVQKVTERLAALFIEKDERDRENLTEDTNQFLEVELEDARRRLVEHEKKVEDYRRAHSNQLPSQGASTLQALQNTQVQLQMLSEAMNRDQERRLVNERQLADLQSPDPETAAGAVPAETAVSPEEILAQKIEAEQNELRLLLLRLKPDHPDVRIAERKIRDLQHALEATVSGRSGRTVENSVPAPQAPVNNAARQRRIQELTALIADIDRQVAAKRDQAHHLEVVIASHQANLDAIPTRESELVELNRDYASLQNAYSTLLAKHQEWKIATNMEKRSLGDQFKVLEAARTPERPVGSRRFKIYAIGSAASLGLGLLLAALLEYFDTSFRTKSDIEEVLKLQVLGSVPLIINRR